MIAPASEPASRSVRQKAANVSFLVQGVRKVFFCSSVPNRMIGVNASELAMIVVNIPAQPADSSSLTIAISSSPRPPPP